MDNSQIILSNLGKDLVPTLLNQCDISTQISLACTNKSFNTSFTNWKDSILKDEAEKKKIGSFACYYSLPGNKFDKCSEILDVYRCLYFNHFSKVDDSEKDDQYHSDLEKLRSEFYAVWNYHKKERDKQGSKLHLDEQSDSKQTFAVYNQSPLGAALGKSFDIICNKGNGRSIEIFLNHCKELQKIPIENDNARVINLCDQEAILFDIITSDRFNETVKDIIMNYLLYDKEGTIEKDNIVAYILSNVLHAKKDYCIDFLSKKIKIDPSNPANDLIEKSRGSWFKVIAVDKRSTIFYHLFFIYPKKRREELNEAIKKTLMITLARSDKNHLNESVKAELSEAILRCSEDIIRWDRDSTIKSVDRALNLIVARCDKAAVIMKLKEVLKSMLEKCDQVVMTESTKKALSLGIEGLNVDFVSEELKKALKSVVDKRKIGWGGSSEKLLGLSIGSNNDIANKLIEQVLEITLKELNKDILEESIKEALLLAIEMNDSTIVNKIVTMPTHIFDPAIIDSDIICDLCCKDLVDVNALFGHKTFLCTFDKCAEKILKRIDSSDNNMHDSKKSFLRKLIFVSQLQQAVKASNEKEIESLLEGKGLGEVKDARKQLLDRAQRYNDHYLIKNILHYLFVANYEKVNDNVDDSLKEALELAINWKHDGIIESIVALPEFDPRLITSPQLLYDIVFKLRRPQDWNNDLFIFNKDLLLALYNKGVDFKTCDNANIVCADGNRISPLESKDCKKYTEEDRNFLLDLFFIKDLQKTNRDTIDQDKEILKRPIELAINWESKDSLIKLVNHPLFCADMISAEYLSKIRAWQDRLSQEEQLAFQKDLLPLLVQKGVGSKTTSQSIVSRHSSSKLTKTDLLEKQKSPVINKNTQKEHFRDQPFIYSIFNKDLNMLSRIGRYKKYATIFSFIILMATYVAKNIQSQ